jgi:hypothetical protein
VKQIRDKLHDNDINGAVSSLTSMIQNASKHCHKRKTEARKKNNAKWWDNEMDTLKHTKAKCLRFLRTENSIYALTKYRSVRKLYKAKIKEKRDIYRTKVKVLIETCMTGSEFWKTVKSLLGSKQCINEISSDEWEQYFNQLLNEDNVTAPDFENM